MTKRTDTLILGAYESWFPIYRNDGLYHRKGGSVLPEWWLSNSGQVAQWEPEYSDILWLTINRRGFEKNM